MPSFPTDGEPLVTAEPPPRPAAPRRRRVPVRRDAAARRAHRIAGGDRSGERGGSARAARRAARRRRRRSPRRPTSIASASSRGSGSCRGSAQGTVRVLVEGVARARVTRYVPGHRLPARDRGADAAAPALGDEDEVLLRRTLSLFEEYVALHRRLPSELVTIIQSADSPARQAFGIAAHLGTRLDRRQGLLGVDELPALLSALGDVLSSEIDLLKLERKIDDDVRGSLFQNQREFYLQEQLKAIHRELGGEDGDDGDDLAAQIEAKGLPEPILARTRRELRRLRRLAAISPEAGVVAHVSRLDRRAAVEGAHRRRARRRARAPRARRGSLRPRRREGPRARLHRRAVARRAARWSDPLSRRPARCGQDVARSVDRARDGTEVRAHVARRRARRGRDPRTSAHVHRRDAGSCHPGDAPRGGRESRHPARRDRQARQRLPRRSVGGAPRGARSGAEQGVQRSLPRGRLRSLAGAVHHDGELARRDPRAAARPDGDHPPRGLPGPGEVRHRAAVPRCRASSSGTASRRRR